jgi:peptide/nickel transport system permease protein
MTDTAQAGPPAADVGAPRPAADRQVRRRMAAVLRPLLNALLLGALVAVITFFLGHAIMSDPGRAILGPTATPEAVSALDRELGVDRPLAEQFGRYVGGLAHGDLGMSWQHPGESVTSIVVDALGVSALLVGLCVVVTTPVATALGLAAAATRSRPADLGVRLLALVGLATPSAFVGLVLMLLVGYLAGLAPVGGWGRGYPDNLRYLWLPVVTLSIYLVPIMLRAVRERARVVLAQPHVEAAVARGVPPLRVMLRHVLPNCVAPILAVVGVHVGVLLGGSVVVEVVFGLPGLGQTLRNAMGAVDLPVLQGVALLSGLLVTLTNGVTEVLQRLVDPRLR